MVVVRAVRLLDEQVLLLLGVNPLLDLRRVSGTSPVIGMFFENVAVSPNGVAEEEIPDVIHPSSFRLIHYGTFIKKRTFYS